jgi:hypothetical protein
MRMTLARHEPCQLLKSYISTNQSQTLDVNYTLALRCQPCSSNWVAGFVQKKACLCPNHASFLLAIPFRWQ